jgi:hypothetical protein
VHCRNKLVASLRAEKHGFDSRQCKTLSFPQKTFRPALGYINMLFRVFPQKGKQVERDANRLPLRRDNVQNGWGGKPMTQGLETSLPSPSS